VVKSYKAISIKRKKVQRQRVKQDRNLLGTGNLTFAVGVIKPGVEEIAKRLMDSIFRFYWKLVYYFI